MQSRVDIAQDTPVYGADGRIGTLRQVLVDSAGGDITHLIVECDDGERLVVPAAMVTRADERTVVLGLSRARLLTEGVVARYRPEGGSPFHDGRPNGAARGGPAPATPVEPPAPAPAPDRTRQSANGAGPPAPGQDASPPPATAQPPPIDTTDPALLRPFAAGVLRIPLRGERLSAARRVVIAREVIVRKERRHETVMVEGTVRKERIEMIDCSASGP